MYAMLGGELGDRFGLLEQFQDDPSFEGSSVRLFHMPILPNLGPLTVQILGSTITLCGCTADWQRCCAGSPPCPIQRLRPIQSWHSITPLSWWRWMRSSRLSGG